MVQLVDCKFCGCHLPRQVPVNPLMKQLYWDEHQQQQHRDFLGQASLRGCQLLPNRRAANISAIRTSQTHKLKATRAIWSKSKWRRGLYHKATGTVEEAQACSFLTRTFFWGSETVNREYGLSQALLATSSVKTYKMLTISGFQTFNLWKVKQSQDAEVGCLPQACRVPTQDCGNNLPFKQLVWFYTCWFIPHIVVKLPPQLKVVL